jgi:hypothetical protein
MKTKISLLALFLTIIVSCSTESNSVNRDLYFSDFENTLKSNMTYNDIVAKFGKPQSDIGSGIHIYVYKLVDSTEIWIGYTDKAEYAKHMDRNGQVINTLFSNFTELTIDFFKANLTVNMNYDEIVTKFGEPQNDIGSGIHIYVYKLVDSTEIWIGYTDKIFYARHMDTNQQLIEDLI